MTDAEGALLADALDLDPSELTAFSREPLGEGTVAGFVLPGGEAAYVDTSLLPVARETGLALEGVARVWRHPSDPHLPALAPAAFGEATAVLLARLGVAASAMPEIVGYRPGRRAVLRVPTSDGTAWVKVVRPRRIARVVECHTALRAHGLPVPEVRGWSPEGLLVLASADGAPATDAAWRAATMLDEVDDLRGRLADAPLAWPARTSLAERLPWYLDRLRAVVPERSAALVQVAARVSTLLEGPSAPAATVHGDLHLGQLFVDGDAVSGLIDVDTAGRGEQAEDAAAFVGHAVASALLTAERGGDAARVWALAAAAHERWGDDPRVRALTAVHLLGHALGAGPAGAAPAPAAPGSGRAGILLDLAENVATAHKRPLMADFEGS